MRRIICALCGREVEIEGYTRRMKYCPDCRVEAHKMMRKLKSSARRKAREMEQGAEDDLHTMDTPENIATCLDCPVPDDCDTTTKKCPLYGSSPSAVRKRKKVER